MAVIAAVLVNTLRGTLSRRCGASSMCGEPLTPVCADASGASLGTATLAPVTAAQRGNQTELVQETATGTVPVGTSSVLFTVNYTRQAGTGDDGYIDDIAMSFG
ncbi:hypothetical protein [Catenulispora rubra]|uniref:hypothetical protein n=1 Tax=Catenulispora rubra TaxID=280293 RepID=UPI0018924800|nr:hypothetical protein [Catenulispora rubra]